MVNLRFAGSAWINIEVALHGVENLYKEEAKDMGLMVLEWYILQSLYEEEGQMASRLAKTVGRAATSFTPILDKLQAKGLIERQLHPTDRRAVKIYLTAQGKALQLQVEESASRVEMFLRQRFSDKEWQAYERAVMTFQTLNP